MASRIKGITIEIGGDTTNLQKSLKGVDSSLRSAKTALNDVNRLLKLDPTNTDLLKQKQELLSKAINTTQERIKKLKEAEQEMAKVAKNGTDEEKAQYEALQREIIQTEQNLKGFQSQQESVNQTFNEMGTASDGALSKIASGVNTQVMMDVANKAAEAGRAVLEFGSNCVSAFSEYDDGIDTIIKKTGITGDTIDEFSTIYNNMVTTLAVTDSYDKCGNAIGEVATQFGFTGDALEEASTRFVKFAEITDSDVTGSIQSCEQVISAFGMTADDIPAILDAVAYSAQATGASTDDIFKAMVNGSGAIQDLGLNAQESALLMGVFTQAGVEANSAVAQLSRANANWAKEGKSMQQGLSELQTYLNGNASDTEKLAAIVEVFGSRGSEKFKKLAESGSLDFAQLSESLSAMGGTVESTYENIIGGDEELALAKQNVSTAMGELGGVIAESLAPILETLAGVVERIANWFTSLPAPIQQAMVIIVALIAVLAVLSPIILAVATANSMLAGSLAPILPIILAVIAVITAIILIVTNWGSIMDWFKGLWDNIVNGIKTAWDTAVGGIQGGVENVVGWFRGLPDRIWGAIGSLKDKLFNWGRDMIQGLIDGIRSLIDRVGDAASDIAGSIRSFLHFSRPDVGPLREYEKWMPDMMRGLASGIENNSYLVEDAVDNIASKMAEPIKKTVSIDSDISQNNPYISAMNDLIDRVDNINSGIYSNAETGENNINLRIDLGGAKVAEQIFRLNQKGKLIFQG